MNDDLVRMWNDDVAYFNILSQNLSDGNDEGHGKS
jgi:hypothetical protein